MAFTRSSLGSFALSNLSTHHRRRLSERKRNISFQLLYTKINTKYNNVPGTIRQHCSGYRFLTTSSSSDVGEEQSHKRSASVSGVVYQYGDKYPIVKLFTKEGCTLCDKVKEILKASVDDFPHTLVQVDITDDGNIGWYNRYKFDIPVLHINDSYWTKHKLDADEVSTAMKEVLQNGAVSFRSGEPNAMKWERKL